MLKKQRESIELQEAQRQNAAYDQLMAERRQQNRLQFVRGIEQQKEFKEIDKVSCTFVNLSENSFHTFYTLRHTVWNKRHVFTINWMQWSKHLNL